MQYGLTPVGQAHGFHVHDSNGADGVVTAVLQRNAKIAFHMPVFQHIILRVALLHVSLDDAHPATEHILTGVPLNR